MISFSFIIEIIGFLLLYVAVDYKRPPEYKLSVDSKEFWIQFLIITLGSLLIQNSYRF